MHDALVFSRDRSRVVLSNCVFYSPPPLRFFFVVVFFSAISNTSCALVPPFLLQFCLAALTPTVLCTVYSPERNKKANFSLLSPLPSYFGLSILIGLVFARKEGLIFFLD